MDFSSAPDVSTDWWDGNGFDLSDLDGLDGGDIDASDLGLDDLDDPPIADPDKDPHDDDPREYDSGEHVRQVLSDTIAERDERIDGYRGSADHEAVRDHLRETGLVEDLQERLDELAYEEYEEPSPRGGVLDMRNVTRVLAGDTTVEDYYREWRWRPHDKIAVGVSLDMSGSMRGDELAAKAAVGAFLFTVQAAGGRVVSNAWRAPAHNADVHIVTAPGERFRWEQLDGTSPSGLTPTGIGLWEAGLMLEQVPMRRHLLIAVTDGSPTIKSREGDYENSMEEAIDTVEQLRNRGLTVVAFGFGRVSRQGLAEIFGDDGSEIVPLEDLADALVECYQEQCQDLAIQTGVV